VFPEEFGDEADTKARAPAHPRVSRLLVLLDDEQPIKYPLYKNVMTIGRSEQADIQINSDFISRVHARLVSSADDVVVEDVDSKNGIRVNSRPVERHTLRHGDVIWLGKLRFTFIDAAASGAD
jgi:pSer/pThr/pTyr-binding forkhead associated (FHA) protein